MKYAPQPAKRQPALRRATMALAVAVAVCEMTGVAQAQEAAQAEAVQSVVVTGSLIRRVATEGATPVTTIKATELESRGHTELKDLVLEQPQSLSLGTNSGAAGPMTNLRGLGPMRTLTLLTVGATSSRLVIASVTACSLLLPAVSVATTVKL